MKYKVTYYERWCREIATIYFTTKQDMLKFISEKGIDQIMSYSKIDKQPEPYEFDRET